MRAVIGVPCGNRFVVFKLLPTFIVNFIFIGIVIIYLGGCLRSVTRLIVEFHILDNGRGDGACRLAVFLHGQVIGVIIFLIFVHIQKFSESTGRIRMLTEILFCCV